MCGRTAVCNTTQELLGAASVSSNGLKLMLKKEICTHALFLVIIFLF